MPRRACVVGWEDQIKRVLVDASEPLTTQEIGRRARVVETGHSLPKLADREAGDPGQRCYRILKKLEGEGLVKRADTFDEWRAYWKATAQLRGDAQRGVTKLDALYDAPAFGASDQAAPGEKDDGRQ